VFTKRESGPNPSNYWKDYNRRSWSRTLFSFSKKGATKNKRGSLLVLQSGKDKGDDERRGGTIQIREKTSWTDVNQQKKCISEINWKR